MIREWYKQFCGPVITMGLILMLIGGFYAAPYDPRSAVWVVLCGLLITITGCVLVVLSDG